MKLTDYAGLNHFENYFSDYRDHYVVVGGFATLMLLDKQLEGHGKATHDIDLVLLTNSSVTMSRRIKSYIKEGDYTVQKGEKDLFSYYRFFEPKIDGFAKEIEIFTVNEQKFELDENQRIIPIDPEEGLYSLSAIMLDNEYFEMIKNNIDDSNQVPCTNTIATMMLKISAFYDLKARGDDKWKKHRRDIIKLALILTGEERIELKGRMIEDVRLFMEHMDELNDKIIKQITGMKGISQSDIVEVLSEVFKGEV
ncbi:hypothetical protein KJ680_07685 [bacterium]|nr:hypothetical protein [bacterium]